MFKGSIEEQAADAQKVLIQIAPDAVCVAQEWDNRVDCLVGMPDGRVVGECVAVSKLTEKRVREAGERLHLRSQGVEVPLLDELLPAARIVSVPRP